MTMMEFAPWLRDLNRFMAAEPAPPAFVPPADVIVTDGGVHVYMDVPGLRAEDLEIELENDTLTIRGERRFPYEQQDGEQQGQQQQRQQRVWRHIERRFGRFQRTLRVPGGLNPDAVEASMADGVLSLSIPRPESPKPHRVQIRAGSSDVEGTAADASGTGDGSPGGQGAPAGQGSPTAS
jgi:HSP20 family protein